MEGLDLGIGLGGGLLNCRGFGGLLCSLGCLEDITGDGGKAAGELSGSEGGSGSSEEPRGGSEGGHGGVEF